MLFLTLKSPDLNVVFFIAESRLHKLNVVLIYLFI